MDKYTKRKKDYSAAEEEFVKACVHFASAMNISNSKMARYLSPLLERTKRGIEQKMSSTRSDMQFEMEFEYEEDVKEARELFTNHLQQTNSNSSENISLTPIQVPIKDERDSLVPFTVDDIGKKAKVKVYNLKPYGAFCKTEDGKTGLLLKHMVTTEFVQNVSDYLQLGDEFHVLIVEDKEKINRALLNAKAIGNIIAIKDRKRTPS